jgi:hypothetical protein
MVGMNENDNTCPTCGLSTEYLTGVRKTTEALDLALESLKMIAIEDVGSAATEADDVLHKINRLMVGDDKAAYRVPDEPSRRPAA